MAYNSGTIRPPVTMPDDVAAALGIQGNDLSAVCQATSINKFARYKPVKHPSVTPITEAQRRSVNHGIVIPDVVTGSAISGALIMDAAGNDWEYEHPTGGANEKFRLSDFGKQGSNSIGYNHYAVPPIQINYPRNGWTYTRGSTSRNLTIYADLDPDDSTINLQAEDFISQGLDLNEWTLIAYVDSPYFSTHLFAADDTILNDGEISGDTIVITIPSGSGSYSANVYICMYRFNSGRYEFLPLPKQGDYNPAQMKLTIRDDAEASGGGIEGDVFQNTTASYALDGVYHSLGDFTDGGECKWALRSSTGNLFFCLQLTNKSGSAATIQRNAFNLALGEDDYQPNFMYNANKRAITSVTIANNDTVTIYLEYDAVLANMPGWYQSKKNSNWSFDLTRSGAYLVGSDMYAFYGSDGWVAR